MKITFQPNSYFQGRDLVITDEEGKSATVNIKDDMPAVEVKDHNTRTSFPAEIVTMMDDLGEQRVQAIYNGLSEDFWEFVPSEAARDHGFCGDVYTAGRSGGWAALYGTTFLTTVTLDEEEPDVFEVHDDEHMAKMEAIDERERFFRWAIQVRAEADHYSGDLFAERIREAHAELEESRDRALIRGEN